MNQTAPVEKKHILVVDDNPANLLLTNNALESLYRISCVKSGDECLELMKKDPADLILMDVGMPSMNGYQCCQQLRADPLFDKLPIVFLTCHTNPDDELKGMEAGGTEYITRPCNIQLIIDRINHHLNASQ